MDGLIMELSLGLLALVGTVVGGYVVRFMTTKEDEIKENTHLNWIKEYLSIASNLVESTVVYYNQTLVPNLKEASADGKLTMEEAKMVFESAKKHVIETLSESAADAVVEMYGDLGKWLDMMIEFYVNKNKEIVGVELLPQVYPTPVDPEYQPLTNPIV